MNKYLCITLSLFSCASLFAQTQPPSVQQSLEQASALYFSYKQNDALKKYIQISKDSGEKDAFLNAVFIAMEQGQTKQAADIALAAYQRYPNDEKVIEFAAEAYLADGQYPSAEKLLAQMQESHERAEFFYITLARAQMGMGEMGLAKYNLKMAARGKNHTALSHYLLGLIYQQEGKNAAAAKAFEVAVAYDHQFMEARKQDAAVLAKLGQYNEAYRQYRIISASDKSNQEIQKAMARLRPLLTQPDPQPSLGKEITKHTYVKPMAEGAGKPQYIRVGIGAGISGKPVHRNTVVFIPSQSFKIREVDSKKVLANGKEKEAWQVVLQKGKPHLLSPSAKQIPFKRAVRVEFAAAKQDQPTTLVKNIMSGAGMTWASVNDKEYRGQLEIIHQSKLNTLIAVNIVTLDEYLAGVIASEMPPAFPIEALRAQAVLARTYALKHLGKHKSYGYDVCDAQNCQVYGGVTAESEPGNAAVESTANQVMLYQNKPIESVFSANCGGITQSAKEAGWTETDYLNPVSDYKDFDFSQIQPYHFQDLLQHAHEAYSRYDKNVSMAAYRWTRVVDEKDLRQVIKKNKKDIGRITAIIPLQRAKSGYVSRVLVKGSKGSVTLNKENVIRNNLSLGLLRSSYFIVQPNYENRELKNFIFYGGGWGHGVGFCQTGSAGRAEAGQKYPEILEHYFPLATLTSTQEE